MIIYSQTARGSAKELVHCNLKASSGAPAGSQGEADAAHYHQWAEQTVSTLRINFRQYLMEVHRTSRHISIPDSRSPS